jgi:hypothetical protein
MKPLQKISEMVGRSYMYKKEVYKITGFIPEDQKVRIKTNREDIVLLDDSLHHTLGMFLEVEEEESERLPATKQQTQMQGTLMELNNILLDNIKRVQDNKEYVQQAGAVNKSVTNITNLIKTQLEFEKLQRK